MGEILGGLGFSTPDYALPMAALSGGQKCRAALARMLLEDNTFLLLDEPTNHLDIDAVRWLEKFLAGHRGGAVVISHDRYLLDRICTRIIEMDGGRTASYPGNYSNYAATRETRLLTQQRQFEKDAEFIRKERDFIARHLAGQRTREAQGRRTRLERMLKAGEFVTEAPSRRRNVRLDFGEGAKDGSGPAVVRCDELTMGFGEENLFANLSFQVFAGDRFAITGPNGTGKTTLLKILIGELAARGGSVELDRALSVGYYGQEHVELDEAHTLIDEIRTVQSAWSEQQIRGYLGRFLFTGDDAFKTLGLLSGGEQSRIRLACLILRQPDILILDEPTNHLDIPSREALEEALGDFPGTIIVVSHDRYFLDRVAGRLMVMRPEGCSAHAGNYSDYIAEVERRREAERVRAEGARRKPAGAGSRGRGKPAEKARRASPYDHLSVEALEALVVERETELAALHERFADSNVYKDPEALEELQEQLDAATAALAEADAAWQERADAQ